MSIADTLLPDAMRLTREEFLRRWESMPELKNAERLGARPGGIGCAVRSTNCLKRAATA